MDFIVLISLSLFFIYFLFIICTHSRKRYENLKSKLLILKQNNFEINKTNDFTFNNKLALRLRLINRFQNSQKIIDKMIRKKYQNEVILKMENNDNKMNQLNFPIVEFVFDEQLLNQCRNKCSEVDLKQGKRFVTRKEYEINEPSLSPTNSLISSTSSSSSSAALDSRSTSSSSLDELKTQSKTINLISNNSKPEMQILKLTRAVDKNHDEKSSRQDDENYKDFDRLHNWNRRSKLGFENEKELQFIFQRMYYRYKSSLPPSPTSKSMSPITKSKSTPSKIETYRKNGRLCSNC